MKSYINPTNETDIESIRKSGYDPVIEDIKNSHISRGHTIVNVRTHQEHYNHYICSCGASINREINNL